MTSQIPIMSSQIPIMTSQIPIMTSQIPNMTSPFDAIASQNMPGTVPFHHLPPLKNQSNSQILHAQGFT